MLIPNFCAIYFLIYPESTPMIYHVTSKHKNTFVSFAVYSMSILKNFFLRTGGGPPGVLFYNFFFIYFFFFFLDIALKIPLVFQIFC